MRKILGLLILGLSLASAIPATANTVTMTLDANLSNNSGGVYTYPYNFDVISNGVTTNDVPLMCDSFLNDVTTGESWKAYVNPITSAATSGGLFNNQAAYDAAGLIYLGALGQGPLASYVTGPGGTAITNLSAGLANWAVWDLFDPGISDPYGTLPFSLTTLNALDSTALGDVNSSTIGLLANVVVYTPVANSQPNGVCLPQEYIGTVPEPGTVALTAAGLIALLGVGRRKGMGFISR